MDCVFNLDTALVRVAGMEHDAMKVQINYNHSNGRKCNSNLCNLIVFAPIHIDSG